MFLTVGERVQYCRKLLNLSRRQLASYLGNLSVPTLSRWELNVHPIPKKKVARLFEFFTNRGLFLQEGWLETGLGLPPVSINSKKFDSSNFDEISYMTFSSLRRDIKDFIFTEVNNNFYQPVINFGDYVGGVVDKEIERLNGRLCFFMSEQRNIVGMFDFHLKQFKNCNQECIIFKEMELNSGEIGEVLCLMRRN